MSGIAEEDVGKAGVLYRWHWHGTLSDLMTFVYHLLQLFYPYTLAWVRVYG